MMHHTVTKIGGKHFARLGAVSDETDRPSRSVRMRAQFLLQREQMRLGVDLKGQRVRGCPLIAAALAIVLPQRAKRIEVRADHEPPRTAVTKLLFVLLSLF